MSTIYSTENRYMFSFDDIVAAMAAKHGVNPYWGVARPGIIYVNDVRQHGHEFEFLVGSSAAKFDLPAVEKAVAEHFGIDLSQSPDLNAPFDQTNALNQWYADGTSVGDPNVVGNVPGNFNQRVLHAGVWNNDVLPGHGDVRRNNFPAGQHVMESNVTVNQANPANTGTLLDHEIANFPGAHNELPNEVVVPVAEPVKVVKNK